MFALSRNPVSGLSIEADFPINSAKKPLETGFLDRKFKKCKDSVFFYSARFYSIMLYLPGGEVARLKPWTLGQLKWKVWPMITSKERAWIKQFLT